MGWAAPQVLIDFASDPLDPLDFSTAADCGSPPLPRHGRRVAS